MSTSWKFIIPLLDKSLTLSDFTLEAGYIGAFVGDKNAPYLDRHVILMYSIEVNNAHAFNTYLKLKKLSTLYKYKTVKIQGHSYGLFIFCRSKTVDEIIHSKLVLSDIQKTRIYAFWNFKDFEINEFMLDNRKVMCFDLNCNQIVPEQDYQVSSGLFGDTADEKSGGLTIVNSSL